MKIIAKNEKEMDINACRTGGAYGYYMSVEESWGDDYNVIFSSTCTIRGSCCPVCGGCHEVCTPDMPFAHHGTWEECIAYIKGYMAACDADSGWNIEYED